MVSVSLLIDEIRYLGAFNFIVLIRYFYRHKFFIHTINFKIGYYICSVTVSTLFYTWTTYTNKILGEKAYS